MAYKTKFTLGQQVGIKHAPDIKGMVTAIHLRKGHRSYEVSYTADQPTNCICEEIELEQPKDGKFGFRGVE